MLLNILLQQFQKKDLEINNITLMDLRTTEEILAIKAEFRKMTGINPDSPNTINELMRFTYDFLIEKFKERHNALMKHNK